MAKKSESFLFGKHEVLIKRLFGEIEHNWSGSILPLEFNNKLISYINAQIDTQYKDLGFNKQANSAAISHHILSKKIDSSSDLILSELSDDEVKKLSENNHSYIELNPFDSVIYELHKRLQDMFSDYIKSPFAFINSRAWITKANSDVAGPNSPHRDGFDDGHLKIMIYPNGLSKDNGQLFIEPQYLNGPNGVCFCFKNSDVTHAGVPGHLHDRLAIEITIMRSFVQLPQINKSHVDGRHFTSPKHIYDLYSRICSKAPYSLQVDDGSKNIFKHKYINIGSGKRNWGSNWLMLDAINAEEVTSMNINADSVFPCLSSTAELIYTSHHLEHQNDANVAQILLESSRCLKKQGIFLVKIPDFDLLIESYLENNSTILENTGWKTSSWSWNYNNISVCSQNAISMLFCSYFNCYYGDKHYDRAKRPTSKNHTQDAFYGPASVPLEFLNKLFETKDPHAISKCLCTFAKNDDNFLLFDHQNAWSKAQFIALASMHGLKPKQNISKDQIIKQFKGIIPDITKMCDWSMYLLFQKE